MTCILQNSLGIELCGSETVGNYDLERKLAFVKALFGVCHNRTCISLQFLTKKLPFESQNVSTEVVFNQREMFESSAFVSSRALFHPW